MAVLLIGEGLARITPRSASGLGPNSGQTLLQGHATRIWSLIPGVNSNGETTATVNAMGLRGAEPQLPRPSERQRILIMGDSWFFGHGVKDTETLAHFLEQRLRAEGVDVDVINTAVPGYSVLQGREFLREDGWDLEPTLMLLGFFWSDNHYANQTDRDLIQTRRSARFNPLVHSVLFQRVVEQVIEVSRPERQTIDNSPTAWEEHMRTDVEGEQFRRVALKDYAEVLSEIALHAAERGAGTVLLSPSNPGQVSGRTPRASSSWTPYYDAQIDIAKAYGLSRIDALPAHRASQLHPDTLFIDDIHPSGLANEIFADAIADALLEAGWPKNSMRAASNPAFDPRAREDVHAETGWASAQDTEMTPPPAPGGSAPQELDRSCRGHDKEAIQNASEDKAEVLEALMLDDLLFAFEEYRRLHAGEDKKGQKVALGQAEGPPVISADQVESMVALIAAHASELGMNEVDFDLRLKAAGIDLRFFSEQIGGKGHPVQEANDLWLECYENVVGEAAPASYHHRARAGGD